jgi:hypothetical protein
MWFIIERGLPCLLVCGTTLTPKVHLMPPMLRMDSSTNAVVDSFPMDIVLCVVFLSEEPKVPPLLAVPRADRPFAIILTSSSPTLTDGNFHDNTSARDPIDPPPPSATFHPKVLPARLTKHTHALLDFIESECDYVSDLALIRDINLPVALGMCHIFCRPHISLKPTFRSSGREPPIPTPSQPSSPSTRTLSSTSDSSSSTSLGPP